MRKQYIAKTLATLPLFIGPLALFSDESGTGCESLLPEAPIKKQQCTASYNLPASISSSNAWGGLFFDVAYTYWYAGEEGLSLGRSGDFIAGDDPLFDTENTVLSQPFEYQSGFKVASGWKKNDWVLSANYTWIRNTVSQNSSAPLLNEAFTTGVWVVAPWFLQVADDGGSLSGTQVASKWHLGMDIADLMLSRPYYQGRYLTITPFVGLRSAWIRQNMDITLTEAPGTILLPAAQPIHSYNSSNSWSIGPRFGSEAHFLLGKGFRIEGDLAVSLLFTEYTKVSHSEDAATIDAFPASVSASIRNKTALRPVLECGLGIGWGSYLCSNKYHVNISADYDFNLWWNQNMMREMMSSLWNGTPTNGDLYLHGLTLSARFDF